MNRAGRILLDAGALIHNIQRVREAAPDSRIIAMVKANAYGHGLVAVASRLEPYADALGVATIEEGIALREARIACPILVLRGFSNAEERDLCFRWKLWPLIHAFHQISLLERHRTQLADLFIKLDTGMHRLGFMPQDLSPVVSRLQRLQDRRSHIVVMTHFACADDPERAETDEQLACYEKAIKTLSGPIEQSLANSAAILTRPESHRDWIRPGIMLYGASPLLDQKASDLGLKPVMCYLAPLIAVRECPAGGAIGYGGTYTCDRNKRVGVVGIGYGDGYPRHAVTGTPVWINGNQSCVLGRVSMDMLSIDLTGISAEVGDWVELWGENVPVDQVARMAGTIAYELFCSVGVRNSAEWMF